MKCTDKESVRWFAISVVVVVARSFDFAASTLGVIANSNKVVTARRLSTEAPSLETKVTGNLFREMELGT